MTKAINAQTSETQENINEIHENSEKIIELISKNDLNEEDLERLKNLITTTDIKIQSNDQGFSLTAIGYTILNKSDDLNLKLL